MPSLTGNPSGAFLPTVKSGINYKLSVDSLREYLYIANLPLIIEDGVIDIPRADSNTSGHLYWEDYIQFKNSVSRWDLSGSNIYNNNAGNVGIGTFSPTKKLTVVGGDALINGLTIGIGGNGLNPQNVAIGNGVMPLSTSSSQGNVAIGHSASLNLTTGSTNVAIGYFAGAAMTTAAANVAIGSSAMNGLSGGLYNTVIGYNAMNTGVGGVASNNVAIGRSAMTSVSGTAVTGSGNTVVGTSSGGITTGSNNVSIGFAITQADVTASNVLTIGSNGNHWITGLGGNIGIGTLTPSEKLEVNGNIKTAPPTNGAGVWKLGKRVAATVVMTTTEYIEVEIDGVTYKLALVN